MPASSSGCGPRRRARSQAARQTPPSRTCGARSRSLLRPISAPGSCSSSASLSGASTAPPRLAAAGSVAFYYATFALVLADRFEAARAAYDAAFEDVRRRGDIFMSAGIHLFRGHLLSRVGELGVAEEDLREALALSSVHGMQT